VAGGAAPSIGVAVAPEEPAAARGVKVVARNPGGNTAVRLDGGESTSRRDWFVGAVGGAYRKLGARLIDAGWVVALGAAFATDAARFQSPWIAWIVLEALRIGTLSATTGGGGAGTARGGQDAGTT
jgi:hypothetical protein